MPVYDSVIINTDVGLPGFSENSHTYMSDGTYRKWQTKSLNPSLDLYLVTQGDAILDTENTAYGNKVMLFRRHPPLQKWTIQNHGMLDDTENVIDTADHWRLIKYSGVLNVIEVAVDSNTIYEYNLEFKNGILQDISQVSVQERDLA